MITLPPLKWVPSPNVKHPRPQKARWLVWHDTEGGYEGAIATFANNHSEVSAHFVLKEDASEVTQMVALGDEAWACKTPNAWSVNLEMSGFAAKGYSDQEWQGAANVIAWLLQKTGIPATPVVKGQGDGFLRHYDLYGLYNNNHTDPTTDAAKWADAVARVQAAYTAMATGGGFPEWPGLKL